MKGDYTNVKRRMRHTYEIHAILTAIYCINETTTKDEDIAKLIKYAFYRVYKEGVYNLKELCAEKQRSDVMPDLLLLLESETEYDFLIIFTENKRLSIHFTLNLNPFYFLTKPNFFNKKYYAKLTS